MLQAFKQAKTYAGMFVIAAVWLIIATWNLKLGIKIFCMLTYYILVNKFLIKGGVIRRTIWNFIYSFSGAVIVLILNKSLAAIALALISKESIIVQGITLVEVLKYVPEACVVSYFGNLCIIGRNNSGSGAR